MIEFRTGPSIIPAPPSMAAASAASPATPATIDGASRRCLTCADSTLCVRDAHERRETRRARKAGFLARRWSILWLFLPAAVLFVPFYLDPLGRILAMSFDRPWPTLAHYRELFTDPFTLRVLVQTLRVSAEITLLCLVLGYPLAYGMLMSGPRAQRVMAILVILPLWTSILVRTYAWMIILGRNGLANEALMALGLVDQPAKLLYTRFAVYVGMVHIMLPFMVLPLYAVMRRVDLGLVAAASSLGAGPRQAFLWVFLPLSLPGVAAGVLLVFMVSLSMFVIPAVLGGLTDITYVMAIEKQVNELNNWELASAMSVLLLGITVLLVFLHDRTASDRPEAGGRLAAAFGRWPVAAMTALSRLAPRRRAADRPPARARPAGAAGHRGVRFVAWTVLVLMAVPLAVMIPLSLSPTAYMHFPPTGFSLRWYENYFTRADWVAPTLTSLQVGGLATIGALAIGIPAAVGLVRGRFPGKSLVAAVLMSPMIMPVMILAIALYHVYARYRMNGTILGMAAAHVVLATPYVILIVSSALRTVDAQLERAAMTLGAGPVTAFRRVTLPLIRPSVLTAAFFAFLTSFDDLVLALFLSGTTASTLPKRMWEGIRFEIDPTTAAVSVLLIAASIALLLVNELLVKRARFGAPADGRAGPA
jgi:putative spermidine/putrescine transport system permease protein